MGLPNHIRKLTNWSLQTLMTAWTDQTVQPDEGPLFQGAMGGTPVFFNGGTVATVTATDSDSVHGAHGLSAGQAVTFSEEMRFVTAVQNSTTVFINAPFTTTPQAGSAFGTTITYGLAESLPSVSIFDFWDPAGAVQRIVDGAAVDTMNVKVNGDFQEFDFAGPSRDLIDSASFASGDGGLSEYPAEPSSWVSITRLSRGIWARCGWARGRINFFTLTAAELTVENNVEFAREGVRERFRALHRGGATEDHAEF